MSQASVHEQAYHLLINTALTYQQIADELKSSAHVVWRVANNRLSEEERKARKAKNYRRAQLGKLNTMYNRKGKNSPFYTGGITIDNDGYALVYKPSWFTGTRGNSSKVFVHHVVVCKRDGMTKVPKGMHVHHINGDKLCNKVWNLALLKSGQHRRIHAILKKVQRLSAYEDIGQRPAWVGLLFRYCLLLMI